MKLTDTVAATVFVPAVGVAWFSCRYERMKPVYNYTRDPCGAVHITIGCGGKPGSPKGALDDLAIEDGEPAQHVAAAATSDMC